MTAAAPEAGMVALRVCPNALLTGAALLALQAVPMWGSPAALAFMVFAMALVARRPAAVAGEIAARTLLIGLVGWSLLSVLWSDYPAVSLRHGVQLAVTVLFAAVVAARLSPLAALKVVAVTFLIAGAASLATGRARADGLGFLGLYGSKNAMAAASSLLLLAGLCLAVDRRLAAGWRLAGLAGVTLGGILMVLANSVGAILSTGAVIAALGLFLALRRMTGPARLVVAVLGGLAAVGAVLVMSAFADELALAFVDATGKDLTLTGRTMLWRTALEQIAARPWLGAGYQAFWVPGNPLAEDLWRTFGVASRTGFHFHNAWLSNAVEIGIVGALIQAAIVLSALAGTIAWVLRDLRAETLFFALFMVRQMVLSMIEVPFFVQFDTATILTVAAAVYAARARAYLAPRAPSTAGTVRRMM